jgi:phosphoribosyl 1,2-cyclic phosphodiesterase/DNA-binding response OmpR family regulator
VSAPMQLTFWGTRGSIAKPGPAFARYGGNTSCVELRSRSGTPVVVDCGTGGHGLGQRLISTGRANRGHLLISHTHWDHIQGIPFFAPLFMAENTWDVYGPGGLSQGLRGTLAGQMEHTYFPIGLDQFAATIRYHDLVEGTFSIDDLRVVARYLNHPALTLGYRFEAEGASLVYSCDHEPHSLGSASGDSPLNGADQRHADFLADADLVIHDAQYTADDFPAKAGWGHSPVEYVVRLCREAGVRKLVLTHHDPLREDDALDRILEGVRRDLQKDGSKLEVIAAYEGLTLEVTGDPDRAAGRAPARFQAKTVISAETRTHPVLLHLNDQDAVGTLAKAVDLEGLPGRVVASHAELLRSAAQDQPSLILIEHNPPEVDGEAKAQAVREHVGAGAVQVPLVLVSRGDRPDRTKKSAATDWLVQPFTLNYARARIRAWVLRSACRWVRAQSPPDEAERLLALRELAILDTPSEERFDRVTRLASAALGVPIAMVSLVDQDRQWFKSCRGLNTRETPRDAAFCAHVVHLRTELVVPDALQDDRFADNPLVASDPRVRFYAGAPLILPNGRCIGTLCVLDTRPRQLDPRELTILRDLRDLALEEIERAKK